ncbi:MAG: hypothetical protein DI598_03875 [Pseudopedobacter saltans]|uniref:CarboxypepD_reg-like domain-containing protein n=1 Tax=Pseudopedobacter saltans TaxID=151895 RepID=A0A2W5F513_9SPHI|nr:MAG: hypothetical protein DI598_03875 [Pseudopedobacter saltans]
MFKQSYNLNIDNPCDQDWNLMTKNDLGGFCSQCSKTVVDFTGLSDKEIIELLNRSSGSLCGRLTSQQMNRPIETQRQYRNSLFKRMIAGMVLFGLTKDSSAKKINTSKEQLVVDNNHLQKSLNIDAEKSIAEDSLKNMLRGIVVDSATQKPISDAVVYINDTKIFARTNDSGIFELQIPNKILSNTFECSISCVGYISKTLNIKRNTLPTEMQLYLTPYDNVGELVLVAGGVMVRKKHWWQFWKRR